MMRLFAFTALAGAIGTTPVTAASADRQMMKLDLDTRIEQRCNARAMGDIDRGHKGLHPDELVAYAFKDTVIRGDVVEAPGAPVRSGDKWYRLSYRCETTPDGMDVVKLSFALGSEVPRALWEEHQLVPQ